MAQLPVRIEIELGGRVSWIPGFGWLFTRLIAAQLRHALETQISAAFAQMGIDLTSKATTKSTSTTRRSGHPLASMVFELDIHVNDYASLKGKIPGLPSMAGGKITSTISTQIDRAILSMIKNQLLAQLPAQIKQGMVSKWVRALDVEMKSG
jgi:hypothetical protein